MNHTHTHTHTHTHIPTLSLSLTPTQWFSCLGTLHSLSLSHALDRKLAFFVFLCWSWDKNKVNIFDRMTSGLVAQSNNVAHNSVQPSKHLDGKLLGISWCSWRGIQNPASKMSFLADGVFVYLKSSGIIGNNPGHGETVKLASWGLSIQRSNQRVNFNKGAVAWHALVTPI